MGGKKRFIQVGCGVLIVLGTLAALREIVVVSARKRLHEIAHAGNQYRSQTEWHPDPRRVETRRRGLDLFTLEADGLLAPDRIPTWFYAIELETRGPNGFLCMAKPK